MSDIFSSKSFMSRYFSGPPKSGGPAKTSGGPAKPKDKAVRKLKRANKLAARAENATVNKKEEYIGKTKKSIRLHKKSLKKASQARETFETLSKEDKNKAIDKMSKKDTTYKKHKAEKDKKYVIK